MIFFWVFLKFYKKKNVMHKYISIVVVYLDQSGEAH